MLALPASRVGEFVARPSEGAPPARVPKASDVLANLLKERILSEGLSPGDRLPPEAELIDEYKFSRGTTREALRMLETDGLVAVRRGPHGGVEVTAPDVTQVTRSMAVLFAFEGTPISDLVAFRLIIEPSAATMAAANATLEQRKELLDATETAAPGSVPRSVDFHRMLGRATNNGFMSTIMTAMNKVLEWQTTRQELTAHEQSDTNSSHRAIAEAVYAGNGEKAAHYMQMHLQEFKALLERQGKLDQPVVPRPTGNGAQPRNAALY